MSSLVHTAYDSTNHTSDHPYSETVHSLGKETATRESSAFTKCSEIPRVPSDLLSGKILHAEHAVNPKTISR
jgi:hypothetical protein